MIDAENVSRDSLISLEENRYEEHNLKHLHIYSYGDAVVNVELEGELPNSISYNRLGKTRYGIRTGEAVVVDNLTKPISYARGTMNVMVGMHVGDCAGIELRIISFVLGLVSCFVILSGVMIWLEACK